MLFQFLNQLFFGFNKLIWLILTVSRRTANGHKLKIIGAELTLNPINKVDEFTIRLNPHSNGANTGKPFSN